MSAGCLTGTTKSLTLKTSMFFRKVSKMRNRPVSFISMTNGCPGNELIIAGSPSHVSTANKRQLDEQRRRITLKYIPFIFHVKILFSSS